MSPVLQKKIIAESIQKNTLFCAINSNNVYIACKKLFFISIDQRDAILTHEIRCLKGERKFVDSYCFLNNDLDKECILKPVALPSFFDTVISYCPILYTGFDYVVPELRQRGICKQLYDFSLDYVFNNNQKLLQDHNWIALVYGLTHHNDYNDLGEGKSRTASIIKSVFKILSNHVVVFKIYLIRFQSYMPQFDQAGKKLSDENSIKGYGNCLLLNINTDE